MNTDYLVLGVNLGVFLLLILSQRKLIKLVIQARKEGVQLPITELYMMMNKEKVEISAFVPTYINIKKSRARIRMEDLKTVYQAGGDLKFFEGGVIFAHHQKLELELDIAVKVASQKRNLLLEVQNWQRKHPNETLVKLEV